MNILLVGTGKTVYFLAREFASKNYRVTLVCPNAGEATLLSRRLRTTVLTGDGSRARVLEEAGARRADALIALLPNDEDNLIACQIAQRLFEVPRTVAFVNDPENEAIFARLGVSVAVSPTLIIAKMVEEQAGLEAVVDLIPLAEGRVQVTEITLAEDAPAVGRRVAELEMPERSLLACVIRSEEVVIPRGDTALAASDRLVLISQPAEHAEALRALIGPEV